MTPPLPAQALALLLLGEEAGRSVRAAWAYFGIVAALLGLFLVVVGLLALARQGRRRRERRAAATGPPPDAWAEAGRRAEPFPQPPPRGRQ